MELSKRKPNRLQDYDYSTPGAYFITICTKNRKCLFWESVGASIARPQTPRLSHYGTIVDEAIRKIPDNYPNTSLDQYVVMPNHVHLLLMIKPNLSNPQEKTPGISRIIQQLKGAITKQIGHCIWQKLFHDHIIRNDREYRKIWEYIQSNPAIWADDCFYEEEPRYELPVGNGAFVKAPDEQCSPLQSYNCR